jgi:hypothetical protein
MMSLQEIHLQTNIFGSSLDETSALFHQARASAEAALAGIGDVKPASAAAMMRQAAPEVHRPRARTHAHIYTDVLRRCGRLLR